jgi:hypothetical protein
VLRDPTFVLRGRPVGLNTIDDPVSLNDLQTRIETFCPSGRSEPPTRLIREPTEALVERLAQLEAWAGEPDM